MSESVVRRVTLPAGVWALRFVAAAILAAVSLMFMPLVDPARHRTTAGA